MKPTRIFATASLIVSSIALITAANISVGDEGVVRMSSFTQEGTAPVPSPDTVGTPGVATVQSPPVMQAPPGPYPQPGNYAPYFERSMGATAVVPGVGYQPVQPFGPIMMFESNIDNGLGYGKGYQRFNARVPYHIVPNTTVLLGDVSASVTFDGNPVFNGGAVYRNYDSLRNRVFGWNGFFDYDEGYGNGDWTRVSGGFESLGKYIDFRGNAYFVLGADSALISSTVSPNLAMSGNSIYKMRTNLQENAYSGFDFEAGGPLPLLGRYGMNMYPGVYYLTNGDGGDTTGFQVRWEALITQNVTVNTYLTTDEKFDTNAWVSLQYEIPNYRNRRTLKPRRTPERLMDPVVRANRIQTHIDSVVSPEALVNTATGTAYNMLHVDPNATAAGNGTFESPYNTLQAAAIANNAGVDIIRVDPRTDDTGTNLTVNGGMNLFDDQVLLSSLEDYTIAPNCIIPADVFNPTPLGPLVSDPNMLAGGSVIHLANNNTILGFRFDASNAANTVFGDGVSNAFPITNVNLTNNTFTDYVVGANLQNVSGDVIIDNNQFNGRAGTSTHGLNLSISAGTTADLLVRDNVANNNSTVGLNIVAQAGSTVNADDPNGNGGATTGILDNTTTGNGTGISTEVQAGGTMNAIVSGNESTDNTVDGFAAEADGGTYNLAAMVGNTFSNNEANGAFIHYLNGGTFNAVSEDLDGDGTLDAGEDLNGNGTLDQGIVSNTMNENEVAGLCIFGENASVGAFDIGGPTAGLGNTFIGNRTAGVAYDLRDTAVGQFDAANNTITSTFTANTTPGVTFVLDFVENGRSVTDPIFGTGTIDGFDFTQFGFAAGQDTTLEQAILAEVITDYLGIPTVSQNANSVIPDGMELNVDFVIGTPGTVPSNGATEYYVVEIGDSNPDQSGIFGVAFLDSVRNGTGTGPNGTTVNGDAVMSVYTDSHIAAGGGVASGNQTFTVNGLSSTISHEIGHTLSLDHIDNGTGVTPNGFVDLMNVSASAADLIAPAEFSYAGTNSDSANPGPRNTIQELVNAVGLRARTQTALGGDGILVNAQDSSRVLASTIVNNSATNLNGDAIDITANDSAQFEGLTISNNTIDNNEIDGIRLTANGPGAFIDADGTIENNVINGNEGDGIGVLVQNGGIVHGNAINNQITNNLGNGIALSIDGSGEIDFGTVASNRVIQGNTITGNFGSGINLNSNATATTTAQLDATILGNTISGNSAGGIVGVASGPNHIPPALPGVQNNNIFNLNIGGTSATDANTIFGNADVGIGVTAQGNSLINMNLTDVTVTGTTNGVDPALNGSGIQIDRQDSSLITAVLDGVTSNDNEGDGLTVLAQGNDRTDPNQPDTGTPNTVTITDSEFSNNDLNGASYTLRGDTTLISDVTLSTFNGNVGDGIRVETNNASSFGDPTVGLPPGRRSIFDGLVVESNGGNGVEIVANDSSRALVEITSTAAAATGSAHAAASTLGNTSISNNGGDGVRITTTGGSSDILITANSATTTIDGNGTAGGGNGIRWDASGTSDGTVRVTRTTISNSIAGVTENTATNNNGLLDPGEDLNGNGQLDPGEDTNSNQDVDVIDGDGIQANFTENTTGTLVVGNVGEGNLIQDNADDGVAITATGRDATGNPRPVITVSDNTIGGTNNGLDAGNGGDGVSLNVMGGVATGIPSGSVDNETANTASTDQINGILGVTESGAVPQFTMSNNLVSNNGQRGVNLQLTGASGTRDREFGASVFDPVRITLTDNTIVSNGTEGVYMRADSDMNQSRFIFLGNPVVDNTNYSPFRPEFFALNAGSVNGNTAYMAPYLNLRTVQNSLLTMTGNTIQNNGVGTVTGEGLRIDVGTGSYVAADIQNNVFGGNLEEDLVTSSFLSAGNTSDSQGTTTVNTQFDYIYLDDTAQLDMRFQNNSGNQIAPSDLGAIYTNLDVLKQQFFGAGVVSRDASLFQVDDGPNLNSPNNTFINFGSTQNIQGAFTNGNYNLRGAADPAWPNIGFAPFLP